MRVGAPWDCVFRETVGAFRRREIPGFGCGGIGNLRPHGGTATAIVLAYAMPARGSAPFHPAVGITAHSWARTILVDTVRMALLAAAALGVGWLVNGARRETLTLDYRSPAQRLHAAVNRLQPPTAAAAPSPSPMDLNAFQAFVTAHKGLVIDARAAAFYRLGHVPGALNLPRESFARDYDGQKAVLEQRKDADIAVYCTEADCHDAELVAGALGRLGFRHLWVYQAGWEEWVDAGLPQEGGPNR